MRAHFSTRETGVPAPAPKPIAPDHEAPRGDPPGNRAGQQEDSPMLPNEFSSLAAIDRIWHDDERLHRKIHQSLLAITRESDCLSAHRDFVANNLLGFGDYAFHAVWSLLVDAMPDTFRFLEIGVHKGNIVSLIGMLARRAGKNAFVVGVSPFNGEGERYGDSADEDHIAAVNALEDWCQIPRPRRARLIVGRSQDHDVREACRASAPYDLVFIDGSKDYQVLESDLVNYAELVAAGGYLVIYRASVGLAMPPGLWPGSADVARAVSTVLDPDPRFRHLAAIGHMRIWTKRAADVPTAVALAAEEIPIPLRFMMGETRRFGRTSEQLPDLVLAFASSYSYDDVEPFLVSLLNHGRNIHLAIFATNMHERFYIVAEQLNIEVIDAQPHLVPGWCVHNIRFRMFQQYLRSTEGKWRNVLLTDIRDVVFQANPFEQPLPAPVVFAAEDLPIGNRGNNHGWLMERYGQETADSLAAYPIVCCGTTIGSHAGVQAYLDALWIEMDSDGYDHNRFLDQGCTNYIAWH